MTDSVSHALNHHVRTRIIEALWHGASPMSAERFHSEFVADEPITLAMVVYHVRQLDRDGIVEWEGQPGASEARPFVLRGPNAGEAIRRLGLKEGRHGEP